MGGCDSGETINLTLSLEQIKRKHEHGGDVIIKWPVGGVQLKKSNTNKKRPRGEEQDMHKSESEDQS